MTQQEFDDEYIITHKLVLTYRNKQETIGVGSINMCRRYVENNPKLNIKIVKL